MNLNNSKTIKDLEFAKILEIISQYCLTEKGQQGALSIEPYRDEGSLLCSLKRADQYLSSFENGNYIPPHGFEDIDKELRLLSIEDSFLDIQGFVRIKNIVETSNTHIRFFEKFQQYYPELFQMSVLLQPNTTISQRIDMVIDKFGHIKDDASPLLKELRSKELAVRSKIGVSFNRVLSHSFSQGYLDDIRESVIDDHRVLAVKPMYRRRVQGSVLGTSKTGSIVFIEPASTEQFSRELGDIKYQQSQETIRILKELTSFIRDFAPILSQYQDYLTAIDIIYAKACFAKDTNSLLPCLTQERLLFLKEAYHPLLLISNNKKGIKTYPQDIVLNQRQRIIVISGPNAGGKSITLKTIGLLQLMLQSGILVPVHHSSKFCFFQTILSDIGDNQSIENHLSTYSYRLKNMNYFLKKCNDKTLFLIDEFGTGSDPELGGALAETFLEEFYHRGAFGVITTHYANLKVLADELECATNANMMFNRETLEPIYRLVLGEAGSSFTFEVAQKNGIPYGLINRAKKKIDKSKVRFDATISKLQKERNLMEKTWSSLRQEQAKASEESSKFQELNSKIQNKLSSYQELYDKNQQYISLGKKIDQLAQKYVEDRKRRPLISDFLKLIESEVSKRTPAQRADKEKEVQIKKVEQEVEKQIDTIRKQKAQQVEQQEQQKKNFTYCVGDRVRITGSKSIGVIDKISKGSAFINYGMFTTEIAIEQIELVESNKK